jgi:hypothetical protein
MLMAHFTAPVAVIFDVSSTLTLAIFVSNQSSGPSAVNDVRGLLLCFVNNSTDGPEMLYFFVASFRGSDLRVYPAHHLIDVHRGSPANGAPFQLGPAHT